MKNNQMKCNEMILRVGDASANEITALFNQSANEITVVRRAGCDVSDAERERQNETIVVTNGM